MTDTTDTRNHGRFGTKIHFRLIELKEDQSWLARKMDVSPQRISQIMQADHLNTKTLDRLTVALEVSASFWL